jgi:hypothetical protein
LGPIFGDKSFGEKSPWRKVVWGKVVWGTGGVPIVFEEKFFTLKLKEISTHP